VSFQRPIFNSGLFGKANRFVCNAWTDSAEAVGENAEGIRWAQQQVVRGEVQDTFLAKLTVASLLSPNRWEYEFEGFLYGPTPARTPQQLAGTFALGVGALNLRETRNTTTAIDGSPLPTGASIGPVGSSYSGGWSTTNLAGYVWMHADYGSDGSLVYWFDAINPIKC
jgi:hypothetical protein